MERTEKRCPQCDLTKPVSEWSKNKSRHDGLNSWCQECWNKNKRVGGKYGERRRSNEKIYGNSLVGGLSRHTCMLLEHHSGMDRNTAEMLSALVHHLDTKCKICGLSEGQRKRLNIRGYDWIEGIRTRLSVDHIIPGTDHSWGNLRVLCLFCNTYRREALFTDHQVLAAAHKHWYDKLGHNFVRSWITPLVYEKGGLDVSVHSR